ncbi:hypothetical protein FKW77_006261 [Venturia effusa]|uniref:Uncharacterized protein n=1 Tax=Venturia effusa TaxID=50376 RepID=A0A517LDV7_9PEZI|nr:hypothetical protein FKW77_006261 [Venturia effusa]
MSRFITTGRSEVDQHHASKSIKNESHDDRDLALQSLPPRMPPERSDDQAVRQPNGATVAYERQTKVTSWLQYNNDSASNFKSNLTRIAAEVMPAATVVPESAVEAEGESEKRLSSADSTEHTPQTTESSNEGQRAESAATSVTPWGTPRVVSIAPTQETRAHRSESPSGISEFNLNPSRYTPSFYSIRDQNSQRINPKVARLKNGRNRRDSLPSTRARTSIGRPSSVAMGKRPVGRYGIGEHDGEFPPIAAHLACYGTWRSTLSQDFSIPARPDSKLQGFPVPTRNSSTKLNASLPLNAETHTLLTASDPHDSQSTPPLIQEKYGFACENPSSPTSSAHSVAPAAYEAPAKVTKENTPTNFGNRFADCAEAFRVLEQRTPCRTDNRAPLSTMFCAVAPPILGSHNELRQTTEMSSTRDYVPLSDACPLLVGSLAMRRELCMQGLDREDPKVYKILTEHHIAVGRVSKPDQILLWHLATHEQSRTLATKVSNKPFSHAIYWRGAGQECSEIDLTLRVFIKWLKEKEQAHSRLYQGELKRLAVRSTPNLVRWAAKRDKYDDQVAGFSGALSLPHEPAAVWLNIYRVMRARGIDEKQLDREEFMALMSKPRHERRAYLDTLATRCKAKTIDNADLDYRSRRQGSSTHANSISTTQIRSPSYSFEAKDEIFELPEVKKYIRRGRSDRRAYPVINSGRQGHVSAGDCDWDTPLGKLPLHKRERLPIPLLKDIELPSNYVPPNRRKEEENELPPNRAIGFGHAKRASLETARRSSQISRFSRDSTQSERERKTRWGRFKRGFRRFLPPCCCG